MEAFRILLLWGFILVGFAVGVTMLFCVSLSGIFQPETCTTLSNFVASVFGGGS